MGDVIDFKSSLKHLGRKPRQDRSGNGDGAELIYDVKPDSVGVNLFCDDEGVAHYTVTAPADDVAVAIQDARNALAQSFGVDPADKEALEAIGSQMGPGAVDAFVTTFVQQHFFAKAELRTGLMTFLSPDYLTEEAPQEGTDYVFKADALIRPSLELTSYDPVSVKLPEKREVSSKDVTEYLDNMANELATWEEDPSRDIVATGDRVTLNLEASVDGKPFAPLTGRHVPYVMGSAVIGEEFDRALDGMKPRERREFSVSIPVPAEDGSAHYQVTNVKAQLDTIQRKVPARIDDEWVVKNMPEAQTLLGLRSRVRTMIEREAELANRDELMDLCADELGKRLADDIDERYVEKMRDELISQFAGELARRGIDYQQYLAQPGFDIEAWERQMTEDALAALRRGFALDSLADHLDLKIEEEDIAKIVGGMAPGYEEAALKGLLDSGQMSKMCELALRMRANEWLVDHVKDASGPKLTLV